MPALEAELQRRRAMLRHIRRGPAQTSVERTVEQLAELIRTRREVGLVLMRYSAESMVAPVGEPPAVQLGEAIGYAGGAVFAPPGSGGAAALDTLLRQPPGGRDAAGAASPPRSQAHLAGANTASATPCGPGPGGWALRRCDHKGNLSQYGVYWLAVGPGGERSEPTLYRDQAENEALRRSDEAEVSGE